MKNCIGQNFTYCTNINKQLTITPIIHRTKYFARPISLWKIITQNFCMVKISWSTVWKKLLNKTSLSLSRRVSFRGVGGIFPLLDPKCPPWDLKKYIDQSWSAPLTFSKLYFAPLARMSGWNRVGLLNKRTETSCGIKRNVLVHPYFTLMCKLTMSHIFTYT